MKGATLTASTTDKPPLFTEKEDSDEDLFATKSDKPQSQVQNTGKEACYKVKFQR